MTVEDSLRAEDEASAAARAEEREFAAHIEQLAAETAERMTRELHEAGLLPAHLRLTFETVPVDG